MSSSDPPIPDLRVLCSDQLLPHEEHDPQRLAPLVARFSTASHLINPPMVAQLDDAGDDEERFVILDGANRWRAFTELGYPHILVQVIDLHTEQVRLQTWNHVLAGAERAALVRALELLPQLELEEGEHAHALAHVVFRDGSILALCTPLQTLREQNTALREIVRCYLSEARLYRTALLEPDDVWAQFPEAQALVFFPHLRPSDIQLAALRGAYMPPGVSRHIIQGRAIRVNYPLQLLLDEGLTLAQKNANLRFWVHEKLKRRQLRFYAESTYMYDE